METELRCYLEGREPTPLPDSFDSWLDPDRTAVVCIDMHRGHIGEGDDTTCPSPRSRARIDVHNEFHAHCRELGIPIVICQCWLRGDGIDDTHARDRGAKANWRWVFELYQPVHNLDEHSLEGSRWLDLLIETDERDYYVRTKKRLSAFYATDLEFLLRKLDVDNVVITGTNLDCCDLATAFDAGDRDFRVIVPRDVGAGHSEESELASLMIMSLYIGLVVDAAPLVREWYARRGRGAPELGPALAPPAAVAG